MGADRTDRPLAGVSVVTTRERPGQLDSILAAAGADVIHVPLIETTEPDDASAVERALAAIDTFDWLVVTSPVGADVVMPHVTGPRPRIGVVGSATAERVRALTGRAPDVVPDRQTALDLVEAMPPPRPGSGLLLAQADRADPAAADGFARRGFDVTAVVAYCTRLRTPSWRERRAMLDADVVAFASGSAVRAWVDAVGTETPRVVASIGPSTTSVAAELGVAVTVTASEHSIGGLAAAIVRSMSATS